MRRQRLTKLFVDVGQGGIESDFLFGVPWANQFGVRRVELVKFGGQLDKEVQGILLGGEQMIKFWPRFRIEVFRFISTEIGPNEKFCRFEVDSKKRRE